jgi:hypothetical protein
MGTEGLHPQVPDEMSPAINLPTEGGGCGHILIYGNGELASIDPKMIEPVAAGMYKMPILKGMPPCPQDIVSTPTIGTGDKSSVRPLRPKKAK